jgi:hypothetical protein
VLSRSDVANLKRGQIIECRAYVFSERGVVMIAFELCLPGTWLPPLSMFQFDGRGFSRLTRMVDEKRIAELSERIVRDFRLLDCREEYA